MKILTFLGTGNYKSAHYAWHEHQCQTEFFPEALGLWLQPQEMLVCLTPEAKAHTHWQHLQDRLRDQVKLTPVDIPSGRNEAELWLIFERLADVLVPEDEVVFDVTHGFRSLPLLSLLAAAYLRVAKRIQLKHLLYGAFEATDTATGQTPVFDLTPFVQLLDWITATDSFLKQGDAEELAGLLHTAHRLPWQQAAPQDRAHLPRRLQGLGDMLRKLSQALLLARPAEVAAYEKDFSQRLTAAEPELNRFARPYALLLEQTRQNYSPFVQRNLHTMRKLVQWYVAHDHTMPAVSLAREWLVSWVCGKLGLPEIEGREEAERAINQLKAQKRGKPLRGEPSAHLPILDAWAESAILVQLWDDVSDVRNDTDHCGFRASPRPAASIVQQVREMAAELDKLPLPDDH